MVNLALQNGLTDIETWRKKLGLYPYGLFKDSDRQFILLNGSSNSFCIDFENKFNPKEYLSFSWSADVESFVSFKDDYLYLYRWFKRNQKPEEFRKDVVTGNLDRFYDYLGESRYNKENSIVTFMMNLFRSLRNTLGDRKGTAGLKALLFLLAWAKDGEGVSLDTWGLDPSGKDLLLSQSPNIIDRFIEELKKGIPHQELEPNLDLVLRHSTGKLFEEAHYEALLNPQLNLWALPDSDIKILEKSKKPFTGVYFTPQFITRSIVEECLGLYMNNGGNTITIFDPACGSGEFLKEAIRQLRLRNFSGNIKIIGWDISESAIDMAKFITHYEKMQSGNANIDLNFRIVGDSMKENWPDDVNILLMNPPYLSWDLMNTDERTTVKQILGNYYKGYPNMASAFLWKAVESLPSKSILGCVMPSSIFYAEAYKNLRDKIQERMANKLIGKLGSYIFYNALVDASIYMASKDESEKNEVIYLWSNNVYKAASDTVRALRIFHDAEEQPVYSDNYSVYKDTEKTWFPISFQSLTLKKKLDELMMLRLKIGEKEALERCALIKASDLFNIRQGVRTGMNEVFLIDRSYFNDLSKKEKQLFQPAISNKSINNGVLSDIEYIWYPYWNVELITSEYALKDRAPKFYTERLKPNKKILQNRRDVMSGRYKWWDLSWKRSWHVKDKMKLVSTEYGKSGSYAVDEKGVYIVQRGYAWLPKKEIPVNLYFAYCTFFNSYFFDELLKIYSKQLLSGYDLGNRFVNVIPIPNLTLSTNNELVNVLAKLGRYKSLGKEISESELFEIIKSLYNK